MGLPYPILKAGGAIVVDSSKAAQISWNAVNENLDSANQLMKQRQEQIKSDYSNMSAMAEKASVLDEEDVNNSLVENRNWYEEQLGKHRNPNSPSFIKELNERMLNTQNLYGKAVASNRSQEENARMIGGLSGYWKKDQMLQGIIQNRATPLSERDDDVLATMMDDPRYYDFDGKMTSFANTYRDGLETLVQGFERDGDHWKFSRDFNPAIHKINKDANGKEFVTYEINPELFKQYMLEDEGFAKSISGKAELTRDNLLSRVDDLTTREANGEDIPASEQLSEWEQNFLEVGGGETASEAQQRMIFNQDMKSRVGTKYQEFYVGATEEKKHRLSLERAKQAAATKGQTVHDKTVAEQKVSQDNLYDAISRGLNPAAAISNLLPQKESGGGVVRNSVRTEIIPDGEFAGLMKITYDTRSVNDYRYKNVRRHNVEYVDPLNRGNVINTVNKLGSFDWDQQNQSGTRKLPERSTLEEGEVTTLKEGVTQKGNKFFKDGKEININELTDGSTASEPPTQQSSGGLPGLE
jgi:hypothetical protein